MNQFKAAALFILKSFIFSVVFICTAFVIFTISPLNTSRQKPADKTTQKYWEEYGRQQAEASKMLDTQKELFRRSEANITEQEKNAKRMSAVLDLWERQGKKGK
jgi:hypothetical protein